MFSDMADLRYEFYIAGAPKQVWDALIKPEEVRSVGQEH